MPIDGQAVQIEFADRATDIDESVWRACFPPPLEGLFWYHTLELSASTTNSSFPTRSSDRPAGRGHRPVFPARCPHHAGRAAAGRICPGPSVQGVPAGGLPAHAFFVGSPCSMKDDRPDSGGETYGRVARAWRRRAGPGPPAQGADDRLQGFPVSRSAGLAGLRGFAATVSYPGTVVALPAPDKDAHHRSLAHTQRHNLLKKMRRSRELLPLDTSVVQRPSDTELAEIFGLFMQTFERGKTKFERLDLRFSSASASSRRPISSSSATRRTARSWPSCWFPPRRPGDQQIHRTRLPPGDQGLSVFRLFDAALDFAYACGAQELQSGQTGYRAKLDLGHRLVPALQCLPPRNLLVHRDFPNNWRPGDLAFA